MRKVDAKVDARRESGLAETRRAVARLGLSEPTSLAYPKESKEFLNGPAEQIPAERGVAGRASAATPDRPAVATRTIANSDRRNNSPDQGDVPAAAIGETRENKDRLAVDLDDRIVRLGEGGEEGALLEWFDRRLHRRPR